MVKDESHFFRLVNLGSRDDVIQEITNCEERLAHLLDGEGQIALIAYVKPSSEANV